MAYDPDRYQLKSVYLPRPLCRIAEAEARNDYMNFSAYIRRLIIDDLKRNERWDYIDE